MVDREHPDQRRIRRADLGVVHGPERVRAGRGASSATPPPGSRPRRSRERRRRTAATTRAGSRARPATAPTSRTPTTPTATGSRVPRPARPSPASTTTRTGCASGARRPTTTRTPGSWRARSSTAPRRRTYDYDARGNLRKAVLPERHGDGVHLRWPRPAHGGAQGRRRDRALPLRRGARTIGRGVEHRRRARRATCTARAPTCRTTWSAATSASASCSTRAEACGPS